MPIHETRRGLASPYPPSVNLSRGNPASGAAIHSGRSRSLRAELSGVPYVHGGDSRRPVLTARGSSIGYSTICSAWTFRAASMVCIGPGSWRSSPLHLGDLVFSIQPRARKNVNADARGRLFGSDRFVHAASEGSKTGVIVSTLQSPYYKDRFLGARRVITWRDPVLPVMITDDDKKIVQTSPFPSQTSVTVRIFIDMTGGGPMVFSILKDDARCSQNASCRARKSGRGDDRG